MGRLKWLQCLISLKKGRWAIVVATFLLFGFSWIFFSQTRFLDSRKTDCETEALRYRSPQLVYSHGLTNDHFFKSNRLSVFGLTSYFTRDVLLRNAGLLYMANYGLFRGGLKPEHLAGYGFTAVFVFFDTFLFSALAALILVCILYLIYRFWIAWSLDQRKILTSLVDKKTMELTLANAELQVSKEEIMKQNAELNIHRNNLEQLVKIRTEGLEKATRKAKESDMLKTAFLSNLSHEIRTPMNAITGFSRLLQSNEFTEEQKKEFIKLIGQSSETLLCLIDDIIDISRIETNNLNISKNRVHVSTLISETISELRFEGKPENVELIQSFKLDAEDEYIYTDKQRLKQVLSNLLRNAFKYTKEGYIELTVKTVDLEELKSRGFSFNILENKLLRPLLFVVEDTGIGIKEKNVELIFEPFQKCDPNTEFYKGMGLGLSIAKKIIALIGGDIIVQSKLGKGTSFSFYIDISNG